MTADAMVRWAALAAMCAWGCAAGDRELEPDELDARDLLGLSPAVAAAWDAEQRAGARARLMDAWAESWNEQGDAAGEAAWPDAARSGRDTDVLAGLDAVDRRRAGSGQAPIIAGAGDIEGRRLRLRIASPLELGLDDASPSGPAIAFEPVDWRADEVALLARGAAWIVDLAAASGHPAGARLRVRAARHAPFGAVYLGERPGMVVNPVLLASIEPSEGGAAAAAERHSVGQATASAADTVVQHAAGGNPYSFYGSVAECAAAQRQRCEACLPSSSCELTSRDAPDGNAECETLAGGDGAGYHLYCVNLSLAIATVAGCVSDDGPGCPQDNGASNQLVRLEANRAFLENQACGDALDACLASIYGEPGGDFPPPPADAGPSPDGGEPPPPPPPPPSPPPRETEIDCGEADCDFSPQCDSSCSSSCDDAFSCNADCNGGEDGCNDSCGGDGGDGGGGGDGGCGGDDDGGGEGGGGGGCGSEGGSGGGDCGDGDCGGGDCGGGDCGGGDCGGDCSGSDCNSSGGGSGNCSVARREREVCWRSSRGTGRARDGRALLSLAWALVPLPYLERRRRRARRAARGQEGR